MRRHPIAFRRHFKRKIAVKALQRCLSESPFHEFVIKFVVLKKTFKKIDKVKERGPNYDRARDFENDIKESLAFDGWLNDDEMDDEAYDELQMEMDSMFWLCDNPYLAAEMSHAKVLRQMFQELPGAIQILTVCGKPIFSARAEYEDFINLVVENTHYPLDSKKDRRFERLRQNKKVGNRFIPFKVILSTNGCDTATLKKLRKKFSKK